MTLHPPTPEQAAICEALRSDGPSIMSKDYAGTGKSSTIEMAAPGWRKPALALAFNRRVADELKRRLPGHFKVQSFNGAGHGVLARTLGGKLDLEERKLAKVINEVAGGADVALTEDQWSAIRQCATKAMLAGVVPNDEGWPLIGESPELWQALASDAGAEEEELEMIASLSRESLVRNNDLTRRGTISFDDQVYFSAVLAPPGAWSKQPLIVVDEMQDANALNHRQIERQLGANSRLMCMGDPLQGIYHFRGATADSMESARALREQWIDLPLTMTFRCPKFIVERQLHHAKGFRASESAPMGEFRRLGTPLDSSESAGESHATRIRWNWGQVPSGDIMVICRNNAPLVGLGFKLIRRGIGVQMLGRDLGKSLGWLAKRIAGGDGANAGLPLRPDFLTKLADWQRQESELAKANHHRVKLERIADQAECLRAAIDSSEAKTLGELRKVLEKLFSGKIGVTLSSIHQAKGMESENVLHLDPWRIPSRWAESESELQQEVNALYVLETRVKRRLIEADLRDFE